MTAAALSWAPEVIADGSGKWSGNALRFATHDEARAYAAELACRWTAVRGWRAVPSTDPVNRAWIDGRAEPTPEQGAPGLANQDAQKSEPGKC